MSSQSSSINSILLLKLILKQLYEFGGPILICIGSIGSILSLIIFTKKNLRKNPCSTYLIAFNIVNLILIYTSILIVTLSLGYDIAPATYNLSLCRYSLYITILLDSLSPSYLILASIDRMLVTSTNVRTRQRSTIRLAYICIISVTLFWILFHSHALFLADIIEITSDRFTCYFQSGIYLIFISYYILIVKVFLLPILMFIFGLCVLKNVRRVRRVEVATIRIIVTGRSKDRQFILMLLFDISIYIIFSIMLSVIVMYEQITQYNVKNSYEIQLEILLRYIATFINYISICIGFYTNLLLSKTFRNKIKKIFLCK